MLNSNFLLKQPEKTKDHVSGWNLLVYLSYRRLLEASQEVERRRTGKAPLATQVTSATGEGVLCSVFNLPISASDTLYGKLPTHQL
jgi:hypothetical protein